ncbi:hypothetical protein ACP70R_014732 [Stipagrostis hirtigluma subsp. patula]
MSPPGASASATATRFAAHWVVDALAGDEDLDFSVIKALVGASPECLAGAPGATRERVALRCLQEAASLAAEGDVAATAGVLRVDAARSCEDLLLELIGEVGSSGNLKKDMLPHFSQDIQNMICIKKPTLPETSFELLKEVDPEIAYLFSPSHLEHNGFNQHDNDHSLCSSRYHVNTENFRLPTDNAELQQEHLADSTNETYTRNLRKDPNIPTSVLPQPCTSDCRSYDHLHGDALGARSPEKSPNVEGDMSGAAVPASASCDTVLHRSITETLSKQDMEDHTTLVQPQSCREKSPNPPDCIDGERTDDGDTSNQSSKDPSHERLRAQGTAAPSHEGLLMHATVVPPFDRSHDVLPANASQPGNLPEFITAQDTTMVSQPHSSKTHLSAPQHESGEKVNQDLADVNASIEPVAKDHVHEELNLQAVGVFLPSVSCNAAIQGEKSETNNQPGNATGYTAPQRESGEKVNEDLGDVSASIQPMEKDHVHDKLNLQAGGVLPSVSCNGAIQGGKSETNKQPGNATGHTTLFEQQNDDRSHPDISCADKVNRAVHDDGSILEKNTVDGGLNVQTDPMSQNCNIALNNKISEASSLSERNNGKNETGVQKYSCRTCVPNSPQVGDGKSSTKTSNKKTFRNTVAEILHGPSSHDSLSGSAAAVLQSMSDKMPLCALDQDTNDSLGGMSQQDLCIKCGKDGQLLKCSGCLLAAHDSCFDSSVTFDETGSCPLCFYTKATVAYQKAKETYHEARKNLAAFLGSTQSTNQHDEQPTGVPSSTANREGHLNGRNVSRKRNSHQDEASNGAHRDDDPDQQRKKQKINATSNACSEEAVTNKASTVRNSDVASMNEQSVLHNNICKRVQDADKMQQVENKEAHEEADNGNSSRETRSSSQNRCEPCSANQEVEADKEDGLTNSHQSDDSDEIEDTSSNNSGKRSSPPWRNMKNSRAGLQEKEAIPSNYRKTTAQQDQHMASSARKRNYARPHKRYSNPVASTGRRSKLRWTEEEESALREAMKKYTPRDGGQIPWVLILERGRDVFHRTRLPADLRVKWRNMNKKLCS